MPWLTALLDVATDDHARELAFWQGVTGYAASPTRGEHDQFLSLVPPTGDPHLRVQRLGEGPSRIHLDVHVPSPALAARQVAALGASVTETLDDIVVMRSPGGMVFCLVRGDEGERAPEAGWDEHTSIIDQVCLDIAPTSYDVECAFWAGFLGLEQRGSSARAEFQHLVRPDGQPLRLLLQRLDEGGGPVGAHLDLATDDRDAEVARHLGLGAVVVRRTPWWTTLRDPAGLAYCVTVRDPTTGLTP